MFLTVGLIVILALTTSLANGQREYKIIEMAGATPYKDTVCPDTCTNSMDAGLIQAKDLLKGELKTIKFPVQFCKECQLTGFQDFTHDIKCFTNEDKTVFDHHFTLTFPNLTGNCECMLSNNPSEAAQSVNEGKLIEGECGQEKFKNTHTCKSIQCAGNEGSGSETVLLSLDLNGAKLTGVLRIDPRTEFKEDAFPIELSMVTKKPAEFIHQASEKFDKSWECLNADHEGFTCHLFATAPVPFFKCLTPDKDANAIQNVLFMYGKC